MNGKLKYNSDEDFRRLEREPDLDPVQSLIHQLRYGELTPQHVLLSARLGHQVALDIIKLIGNPTIDMVDWTIWSARRDILIEAAQSLFPRENKSKNNRFTKPQRQFLTNFSCDVVERVLGAFEKRYHEDKRPRQAIELARRCASGENISIDSLRAAAEVSYFSAFFSIPIYTAISVTFSGAAAAAGRAAGRAATALAVLESSEALRTAEHQWQKNLLIQYILGEI